MKNIYSIEDCKRCSYDCLKVADLSNGELQALNDDKREMTYNKGETIFKQGAYVSHIIYLKKGLVKLLVEGNNDKNLIIKFISSGHFIGFPALDSEDYYPFTVVAEKKSAVCLVKKEKLFDLMANNHLLSRKIIAWYGQDYRFMYNKFASIGTKNIHGRLATALLYLCQEEFQKEAIFEHITRREMAQLAGMSVESMLKIFQELKADNIIATKGKTVIIQDYDMLVRLSRIG